MSTPLPDPLVELAADLGELVCFVVAHDDASLLGLADAGRDGSAVGLAPGHLEPPDHHGLHLELDEPRWNDVHADVVVLQPEPNHWTAHRLLEAVTSAGTPGLVVVLLPDDPDLRGRDAYPPGSAVPAHARVPTTIGAGTGAGRSRWHVADGSDGARDGVAAAVRNFVAAGVGEWTLVEQAGVAWLVSTEASEALRSVVPSATGTEDDPPGAGPSTGGDPAPVDDVPPRTSALEPADDTTAAALSPDGAPVAAADGPPEIAEPSRTDRSSGAPEDGSSVDGSRSADAVDDGPRDLDPERGSRSASDADADGPDVVDAVAGAEETLLERRSRQLRAADAEILKVKEQRHRLRERVAEIPRLERRLEALEARRRRELAERDDLVARVERRLEAAIGWQTRLREEGDRLRQRLREVEAERDRAIDEAARGARAHDALRGLAVERARADDDGSPDA